mgnify:CR=1 FL=1
MINYKYDLENSIKDSAVERFKKSDFANHPNLNHTADLNRCVDELPRTKFRKAGKKNYSYFHCDKNSQHLLIIPNVPFILLNISTCGQFADLSINNEKSQRVQLSQIKPHETVYAFKGPITINGKEYDLTNACSVLLSDPDAPRGGNRSVLGYDQ